MGAALSTHSPGVSTILLEKSTNGLEIPVATLQTGVGTPKTVTFGTYLNSVLNELGLNPYNVEQRSKDEARRRGVEVKSYMISNSTITNILNDVPGNYQMSKLCGLAWSIGRPVEEVVAHAFGFANRLPEFQKSEAFKMWEVQQKLTGDQAKYFAQRIADLRREIERILITKQER